MEVRPSVPDLTRMRRGPAARAPQVDGEATRPAKESFRSPAAVPRTPRDHSKPAPRDRGRRLRPLAQRCVEGEGGVAPGRLSTFRSVGAKFELQRVPFPPTLHQRSFQDGAKSKAPCASVTSRGEFESRPLSRSPAKDRNPSLKRSFRQGGQLCLDPDMTGCATYAKIVERSSSATFHLVGRESLVLLLCVIPSLLNSCPSFRLPDAGSLLPA